MFFANRTVIVRIMVGSMTGIRRRMLIADFGANFSAVIAVFGTVVEREQMQRRQAGKSEQTEPDNGTGYKPAPIQNPCLVTKSTNHGVMLLKSDEDVKSNGVALAGNRSIARIDNESANIMMVLFPIHTHYDNNGKLDR